MIERSALNVILIVRVANTMNRILSLLILFFFFAGNLLAQSQVPAKNTPPPPSNQNQGRMVNDGVVEDPDRNAHFPCSEVNLKRQGDNCMGGAELQRYLADNVQYPKEAIVNNEQGRVYVTFLIDPTGRIFNITIERSVSPSLDAEAIRLIKGMPLWVPAEKNGAKCVGRARVPINFVLTN